MENIVMDDKFEKKAYKKAMGNGEDIEYDINEESGEDTDINELAEILRQKKEAETKKG